MILDLITLLGGLLASLGAYFYFRPPQIGPISEETLVHLKRLSGRRGDISDG